MLITIVTIITATINLRITAMKTTITNSFKLPKGYFTIVRKNLHYFLPYSAKKQIAIEIN